MGERERENCRRELNDKAVEERKRQENGTERMEIKNSMIKRMIPHVRK